MCLHIHALNTQFASCRYNLSFYFQCILECNPLPPHHRPAVKFKSPKVSYDIGRKSLTLYSREFLVSEEPYVVTWHKATQMCDIDLKCVTAQHTGELRIELSATAVPPNLANRIILKEHNNNDNKTRKIEIDPLETDGYVFKLPESTFSGLGWCLYAVWRLLMEWVLFVVYFVYT